MTPPTPSLFSEQVYESFVPGRYIGFPLVKYFADRFTYLPESGWEKMIREGRITVNGAATSPGYLLGEKDRTETRMPARQEPPANRNLEVVYQDSALRVFNKAAPIPVHPSGRYFKNSMTELLKETYPGEVPRPVQRLDATTTGVIVFARTREAAAALMHEFKQNRVEKEYLALVEGQPRERRFVVDRAIGKVQGSRRGSGEKVLNPKPAVTEFELLATLAGRSLLKVKPHTGRTNQIRVHLSDLGLPVINDTVYGWPTGESQEFGLHASRLRFTLGALELDLTCPSPGHFAPFLEAACREGTV